MIATIEKSQLEKLFDLIKKEYEIVAPVLKEGVIQLSVVNSLNQLPFGYREIEEKNFYRVEKSNDEYMFSYIRPSFPYKRFLIPPEFTFLKVRKENGKLEFEEVDVEKKYAFFDVRGCDLRGINVLDNIFLNKNEHPDSYYEKVRKNIFIVSVTCRKPSDVCFCYSMGVSPKPKSGFDILITELENTLLIETGTDKGKEIVKKLDYREVREEEIEEAKRIEENCIKSLKRKLDTEDFPEILYKNIESDIWDEIGKRCFACTSCTQVCPTCFCFDIVERNDVNEGISEKIRVYDSCFNPSFATVHRFNIRESIASRYRQWYMHKFAYWVDQFGEFGCVGCGRCITWCPASIDVTEEEKKIRRL